MNRKFSLLDIARIITGFCLTVLTSYMLFNSIETQVVSSRGHSYSLDENPIMFFVLCGAYIVAGLCGIFLTIQGMFRSENT